MEFITPFMNKKFEFNSWYKTKDGKEGFLVEVNISAFEGETLFRFTLFNTDTNEYIKVYEEDFKNV